MVLDNVVEDIQLSDAAVAFLKDAREKKGLSEEYGLKLMRENGAACGCSGPGYVAAFDVKTEGDLVYDTNGFPLFVPPESAADLEGVTIDYDGERGLRLDNPEYEAAGCGCGSGGGCC